eukprot:jgi/Undpi1/5126/HiC_scaffold_19.g08478.m1
MSEQLPPLVSHESLRIVTAAAQVGKVSPDVLSFLSASTEYHLLDVVNDADNFRARGKRSRLTVDDINASLELRGAESSLVFSGGMATLRDDGSSEAARTVLGADSKVDLRKVANASLPVCPIEPGFDMHWLAVDGQQPLLPQNPIPSSAARGKGKGGKRGRSKEPGEAGTADRGSAVRARLSEELTTYLRRCCEAVLSRDEAKRGRALASLRTDPGLQQLLPHLCTFIQTKVTEYLKRQKDPDQLATLLQMLNCLLNNSHFAFLEIYVREGGDGGVGGGKKREEEEGMGDRERGRGREGMGWEGEKEGEKEGMGRRKGGRGTEEGREGERNPCEAAAEGRQVGEDINTKCTGDIKVGDLLKKAGDHLLDIHPAFHSHGATRAFDIENPCEAAAEGRQVGEDINTKCTGDIKVGDLLKKAGDHLLDIHPAFHSHGATRAFDIENPCEAAAEGRQVGEDINTKCTGDIKVGDLLKKAGDHLLDIHPAFHSHGATRAFDIEIHKTIDKKQECKVLGTSAEEEESKQACMLLRKQC